MKMDKLRINLVQDIVLKLARESSLRLILWILKSNFLMLWTTNWKFQLLMNCFPFESCCPIWKSPISELLKAFWIWLSRCLSQLVSQARNSFGVASWCLWGESLTNLLINLLWLSSTIKKNWLLLRKLAK